MTELFTYILLYLTFLAFASRRTLVYLHAYQQEEYDSARFFSWYAKNKLFDKKISALLFAPGILWFFAGEYVAFVNLLVVAIFCFGAYKEKDPRQESKKKLAMTSRAQRIFTAAMILMFALASFVFLFHVPLIWIICVQLIPIILLAGNEILAPYETLVQQRYWREAHDKLNALDTTVIGVTGSFGKTSVKHILAHILQTNAPTLATPGSVNTPMGITRIIREELDERHKFFIVEMGAYGPGSIKRLCALAPPDYGVITAIGHAHYERFKTLETVAKAKFELADAALDKQGSIIVNELTLKFPYTKSFANNHRENMKIVGSEGDTDIHIEDIRQTLRGLEVRIHWKKETHILDAPLFGSHHGENMTIAFATACELGMEPKDVLNALKTTPQIPHRLQVKTLQPTKAVLIDDAFNSNPRGFKAALDLLGDVGQNKRKILITPGMVELGSAHAEIHTQIGSYAAGNCDILIAVNPKRIPTFIAAFKHHGGTNVIEVASFEDAQKWMNENLTGDDIVLIENDLPDIYETLPKF